MSERQLPAWADPSVSSSALDPQGVSRRGLLRRAGLFGAAFAAGSLAAPAVAAPGSGSRRPGGEDPRLAHLVGDHHVHTVYSHDAEYTFSQLARAGAEYGLDRTVFTEHSDVGQAAHGARLQRAEILRARAENPRQLIFQGLEWYIPGAEHGTVFAAPQRRQAERRGLPGDRGRPARPGPARAGRRRPVGGHVVLLEPGVRGRGGRLSMR